MMMNCAESNIQTDYFEFTPPDMAFERIST